MKRRRYTGIIRCEFCPKVVGGGSKSGLFANYTSHVLAAHPTLEAAPGYKASLFGAEKVPA